MKYKLLILSLFLSISVFGQSSKEKKAEKLLMLIQKNELEELMETYKLLLVDYNLYEDERKNTVEFNKILEEENEKSIATLINEISYYYSRNMSEKELEECISFFESNAGKKYLTTSEKIVSFDELKNIIGKEVEESKKRINERFDKEIKSNKRLTYLQQIDEIKPSETETLPPSPSKAK